MPRLLNKLSAIIVQKTKTPGYYGDGGGLWLQVSKLGGKSWVFRYTYHRRPREMGLGAVSTVSLAEARSSALQNRKLLLEGLDPIQERHARLQRIAADAAVPTFKECASTYIDFQKPGWGNPKHAKQWSSTLETYALPFIGDKRVNKVIVEDILKVLKQPVEDEQKPFWETKTETASRVRGRIEQILDWAAFKKYRSVENPARWRGNLDKELPPKSAVQEVSHHPALPYERIGPFMVDLQKRKGVSAQALEFEIVTATRSHEVRGMRWLEVDLDKCQWRIPPERMKGRKGRKREHLVPLSHRALQILNARPKIDGCELVFPNTEGEPLSDAAISVVIDDMHAASIKNGGIGYFDPKQNRIATPHGTARSTFRDWAGDTTSHAREVIEFALAHKLKDKTEAAYYRGNLYAKRTLLMKEWADYCESEREKYDSLANKERAGIADNQIPYDCVASQSLNAKSNQRNAVSV